MRVRIKWGKKADDETTLAALAREGEFISVRQLDDSAYRYKVNAIEHLVDERRPGGIPDTGLAAILWCKDYTSQGKEPKA